MKTIGKIANVFRTITGDNIIQLISNDFRAIDELAQLDTTKHYDIEIKEHKSKRSLEQNRMLWELLAQIDKAMNGTSDELEIYAMLLEKAGAKYDYIAALPETEEALRKSFRAVKFIKKVVVNEKELNMYKVFFGSSQMNTAEMSKLLDSALDLATQLGIPTELER